MSISGTKNMNEPRPNRRQRRLGIRMTLEYEVEVRDRNGKLLTKLKRKGDPFLRNWIRMLRTCFLAVSNLAIVSVSLLDVSGASRSFYGSHNSISSAGWLCCGAPAGTDTYGIQVGNSNTAFDRAHYSLQGKIVHGSGAGQLLYGVVTVEDYVDEDSTTRFRAIRAFTNSSGGSITVREIGMALRHALSIGTSDFMICRDVLASEVVVPDGSTLTVRYRMFISYA